MNAKWLTEAEEQRVHAHAVHAEEAVGDEVGSHDQRLGGEKKWHAWGTLLGHRRAERITITASHQDGHPVVVQRWNGLAHRSDFTREEEEGEDACTEQKGVLERERE